MTEKVIIFLIDSVICSFYYNFFSIISAQFGITSLKKFVMMLILLHKPTEMMIAFSQLLLS